MGPQSRLSRYPFFGSSDARIKMTKEIRLASLSYRVSWLYHAITFKTWAVNFAEARVSRDTVSLPLRYTTSGFREIAILFNRQECYTARDIAEVAPASRYKLLDGVSWARWNIFAGEWKLRKKFASADFAEDEKSWFPFLELGYFSYQKMKSVNSLCKAEM